ncbi:hypothetical protein PR202_gb04612 [Eleusine coracana subsp. coracana]|uniref:RNA helicase n=1 Tax=Eleusine coracana subsp. coracana TaxID=191504 RepID=A0AAV5E4X7_ELECO|nr:hypothetical protein PR202_gb04612 [Eleusine coracana subsp. coracana]
MGTKCLKEKEEAAGAAAGGSGSGGRKGKNNGRAKKLIREETLVHASKVLEEFRASDAEVYTFDPGMSNQERAAIHKMCKEMGMRSKSSGSGKQRHLSVYKQKKKRRPEMEVGPSHLGFSEDTRHVLQELFTHYPPGDADLNGDVVKNSSDKAANIGWKDSAFCKPAFHKSDIAKKVEMHTSKINGSAKLRKIVEDRSKLPISSFKDVISSTLVNHQVPQYILEHMWGKGESCKIICTQPRRISAISVADRISAERGESVGETVGYKIRLESKGGKHSSIMFCTNGILLRLLIGRGTNTTSNKQYLKSDNPIMGITHIIVDEIHERDKFCDFMLTILRDLLPLYPHLRLVLMSATLDAERFSKYFSGCPVIQVPGFTYPVKTFYLEDVLSILHSAGNSHVNCTYSDLMQNCALTDNLKSSLDESINLALANDEFDPLLELISAEQNSEIYNYHHSETGVTPLMVFAAKGQLGDVCMLLSFGVDCSAHDHNGKSALHWAQQENQQEVKLLDSKCKIAEFLKKTMDPPIQETISNAITVLQDLGALTEDEELTELGEKLGSLPVHPSTTKMLLFAIVMNCLDPALTLACATDYRDPFLLPMTPDERTRAAAAKVELASLYGGFSDQLTVVAAFDCWRHAKDSGQESQFCRKYFISSNIMNMLSNMRKQLQNELSQRGFIPADTSACSLNSKDPEMDVAPPDDSDEEDEDSTADGDEEISVVQRKKEIMSSPDDTVSVVVDRWIRFEAMALEVAQIYCLRERLASAILFKVKYPQDVLPSALGASMYAIACILSYDGLPAVVRSNDLSSNQASNQNSAEANTFFYGRGVGVSGHIQPQRPFGRARRQRYAQ